MLSELPRNPLRESWSGKAIEARFKEHQALYEISQEVLNSLDLNIVLERTLQKTLAIESFDFGVIRLLDPVTEILKPVVSRGFKDPQSLREHRMGHIIAGKIIGQRDMSLTPVAPTDGNGPNRT